LLSSTCGHGDRLLREAFQPFAAAFDHPADVAVFRRRGFGGRWVYYFTPRAKGFATALGAQPSMRPAANDLELLCGSRCSWDSVFHSDRSG
jgi:hypothetical protein